MMTTIRHHSLPARDSTNVGLDVAGRSVPVVDDDDDDGHEDFSLTFSCDPLDCDCCWWESNRLVH